MYLAPIRLALVDDHKLFLDALTGLINACDDMQVVCTAGDGDEGLEKIIALKPDIAILDVDLPGRGAFDVAAEIRSRLRATRIIFLTGFVSDVLVDQALRLRASGYLLKSEPIEAFIECVRNVASGRTIFSRVVEERLTYDSARKRFVLHSAHPLSDLTSRQLEVLRHLAKGESVKQVAVQMHLSEKSIDSHKYRIMHKLAIHDRVELARYAIREGLLLP